MVNKVILCMFCNRIYTTHCVSVHEDLDLFLSTLSLLETLVKTTGNAATLTACVSVCVCTND